MNMGMNTAAGYEYCSAIGQDSHRFVSAEGLAAQPQRQLMLAGLALPGETPLAGNSDADVVLHALTNAISGISGVNILGARTDQLCLAEGITDSAAYLREALATLGLWQLCHISLAVEAKTPRLAGLVESMKIRLAELTGLQPSDIGLTATTGEGLTAFGRGEGIQVFCQVTARRLQPEPT